MADARKGVDEGTARGGSTFARFRQTDIRKARIAGNRTRTFRSLAARAGCAAPTTIDHSATSDAAIDGDGTSAPRTEDVRHRRALAIAAASVNGGGRAARPAASAAGASGALARRRARPYVRCSGDQRVGRPARTESERIPRSNGARSRRNAGAQATSPHPISSGPVARSARRGRIALHRARVSGDPEGPVGRRRHPPSFPGAPPSLRRASAADGTATTTLSAAKIAVQSTVRA